MQVLRQFLSVSRLLQRVGAKSNTEATRKNLSTNNMPLKDLYPFYSRFSKSPHFPSEPLAFALTDFVTGEGAEEREQFLHYLWYEFKKWRASKHHGIIGIQANSEIRADEKKIEIHLDVHGYLPEHLEVKTVGCEVRVRGAKEVLRKRYDEEASERSYNSHYWDRREFERRFLLPVGLPPEKVVCRFDKGKLLLLAFRADPVPDREVPIEDISYAPKTTERSDGEST